MSSAGAAFDIFLFAVFFWLGAYLVGRDPRRLRVWLAGAALVAYAVVWGVGALAWVSSSPALSMSLRAAVRPLEFLPALLWIGQVVVLLAGQRRTKIAPFQLAAIALLIVATGLLLLPLDPAPRLVIVLLIGVDLASLGIAFAARDAAEEGERLLLDLVRSLDASIVAVLLFGGQVMAAIAFGLGPRIPMVVLLLTTTATAIVAQTFSDRVQALVDTIAFGRLERLRRARADLRATTSALPKTNAGVDLAGLDDEAFARLTRRALSQYGNLPRLATSPLIFLPEVDLRLLARGADDNPLERAAELKGLLAESVARLKPRTQSAFGASDEWRHYNALYFPYVIGLKPYSRGRHNGHTNSTTKAALAWFQTFVPERTLYNWQKSAAEMVAWDLRAKTTGGIPSE